LSDQENGGLDALFGWEPDHRPLRVKLKDPDFRACYVLLLKTRLAEMEIR
jgi:hypothetical protein